MSDTEVVDVKTGEVAETAMIPVDALRSLVKAADLPVLEMAQQLANLNWRDMKPPLTAYFLTLKPTTVSGGGIMYLTLRQALWFAIRCYELDVSPFSAEVWFDPQRFAVNLTLEGKRQVARNKGIDLGPPKFEELERPWDKVPKVTDTVKELQKQGFTKDVGVKCRIRVGDPKFSEEVEYICWLSEWMVTKSPVWQNRPLHMLQTRACEKAISMALGTGASDPLTDE